MKTKAQKKEAVDALAKALPETTITIFTTFARKGAPGLSVAQMQQLKRAVRAQGGTYLVAKKTLIQKALEQLKYDGLDVFSDDGSMGIVMASGDAYAITKAIAQFAKQAQALQFLGAWMDGHALTREQVVEMATLPSRDELIARLLGMLMYPLSSLAIVLNQVAKQKESAPTAA